MYGSQLCIRFDYLEEILLVIKENYNRCKNYSIVFMFGVIVYQYKERCNEVQQQVIVEKYRVVFLLFLEVYSFFIDVVVLNQYVLRELQVGLKDIECKQVFIEVMQVFLCNVLQIVFVFQVGNQYNSGSYCCYELVCFGVLCKQCRVLVGINGYNLKLDYCCIGEFCNRKECG